MAETVYLRQTESEAQASHRVTFSIRAFGFVPGAGGSPPPWEEVRQLVAFRDYVSVL